MGKVSDVRKDGVKFVQPASTQLLLPDAESTAEIVLHQAMEFCAKRMGLADAQTAIRQMQEGDKAACSYCQYSVAKQVAEALGSLDENIKAVYVFDYDATPEDLCLSATAQLVPVHLLVWAARTTSALSSMIEGLDRALARGCAKVMGKPHSTVLDVQVVTDDDVENHTGYGALMHSLFHRPIKIWER